MQPRHQLIKPSTHSKSPFDLSSQPYWNIYPSFADQNGQNKESSSKNYLLSGTGWLSSSSEEESNDSEVSFELSQLTQHKICLRQRTTRIFDYFFLQEWFADFIEQKEGDVGPVTLEEYLDEDYSLASTKQMEEFKQSLEREESLWGLLKYIYDEVSQVLVPELLLAGLRATRYYRHLLECDLNQQELHKFSGSPTLINEVFNHPSFQLFALENIQHPQSELHQFCRFYLTTVLFALENYFTNPYYCPPIITEVLHGVGSTVAGKRKAIKKRRECR